MNVQFIDHSDEVLAAMREAAVRALEKCGLQAEKYAKKLAPVDTGNLRNRITHTVDEKEPAAYVGTNVEYAPYVELGTGAENYPGGRPDPWAYKDDEGNWHRTSGHKARPFLKPAVANHSQTYINIIKDELKNG